MTQVAVEAAVIALLLTSENQSPIRIESYYFTDDNLRALFSIIKKSLKEGKLPNWNNISTLCEEHGFTQLSVLEDLDKIDVSDMSLESEVRILRDAYQRRQAKTLASGLLKDLQTKDVKELSDKIISFPGVVLDDADDIKALAPLNNSEIGFRAREIIYGLPTNSFAKSGVKELDELFEHFLGHTLVVVLADTNIGKSSFLLQTAISTAESYAETGNGQTVFVFTIEDGPDLWIKRAVAHISKVGFNKLNSKSSNGICMDDNRSKVESAIYRISDTDQLPIELSGLGHLELIRGTIEQKIRQGIKPGAVFIDHIQVMSSGLNNANTEQEYRYIIRNLKQMAVDNRFQLWISSQISQKDGGAIDPMGARAIGQEATAIIYILESKESPDNTMIIKCLKNKLGGKFAPIKVKVDKSTFTWSTTEFADPVVNPYFK